MTQLSSNAVVQNPVVGLIESDGDDDEDGSGSGGGKVGRGGRWAPGERDKDKV